MPAWLSPEWFETARAGSATCPERPGLSGTVQCEVTGGPTGTLRCFAVLEDGRLRDGSTGKAPNPDIGLSATWEDATAVARGTLDPSVAFMRGRLKVTGSMELFVDLLAGTSSAACRDARTRLAALTQF